MRKVLQWAGLALGLSAVPTLASAQKALVYCPVSIDRAGCDAIAAALTGPAYPGGVDLGYNGTGGTVDLRTVDLFAYHVFLVPSLADDATTRPYAFLRDSVVVEHLRAALIGGLSVWSGMPDQGTSNRAAKDQLIRGLASWAGANFATAHGPGLVAFLDLSEDEGARYDWLRAITPFKVTSDIALISYDSVRALTPRASTILGSGASQLGYPGMAAFGLATMSPTPGISLDAVGSTGTSQGGQVVLVTLVAGNTSDPTISTDRQDYAPGDTVTFNGTGWGASEIVTIVIHEDPLQHTDRIITAVADGFGNFSDNSFVIEPQHLLVRFVATATGGTSGARAQATFTDGNPQTLTISVGQSPNPVNAGSSATYTVRLTYTGNATNCRVVLTWATTGLPAWPAAPPGGFFDFSPDTLIGNGSASGTPKLSSLTIAAPAGMAPGTYNFTVGITYPVGHGCQNTNANPTVAGTFVVVAAPNVAPVLDPIGDKAVNEGVLLSFTATATDANPGQTKTFSLDAGSPAGAAITAGGAFTWTPTEAQGPGSFPITIRVTDNGSPALSDTETITVTVGEVNLAPVLGTIGNQTVAEGALLSFAATATDADLPANALTFSLDVSAPTGAAITSGGAFTFTPTEAQGPGVYSVTVRVADNGSPSLNASETFDITVTEVNAAPVITDVPPTVTIPELVAYGFDANATDADAPAQTLTFSLSGAPSGATIDGTSGVFSWTPTEAQGPGLYSFNVVVSDGVTSTSAPISLTVTEVNLAPVLGAVGNQVVNEGVLLSFTATATDADLPANTLTFSLDAGAPTGAAITAAGAFTFTPTEAQGPGVYPVTIRVTDNGTPSLDDFETFNITVNEVNGAPVLSGVPATATIPELAAYGFDADATDPDVPVQPLIFSLSGAPAGATIDGTTGVFSWTPTEAQGPGVYTFDVVVGDGVTTTPSSITITVQEVNLAPMLDAVGNKSVDELAALTFTVTATDPDLPAQSLTFSLDAGAPAGATITAAGAFSWTPTEAQGPGVYPVTIRVADNGTPTLDDFETINITVNEVNVAPVLTGVPATATIPELAAYGFDANATDADIPVQTLTFSLSGAPSGASIDPSTGVFSWTPTEAQGPGVYTFSVVVGDGVTTTPSSITLTVQEVNQAPVLGAVGNKSVNELVALTFTAGATDGDLPANTLTYSLIGGPSGATIDGTSGAFSWTPAENQDGVHSVTVRVSDGTDIDEETISITVNEVNVAPTLTAIGNKTTDELANLTFVIAGTDPDVVAGVPNTLTFTAPTLPAGAVFTPGTQTFSWTPAENQDGVHSASFQVSDGALTDDETISITVAEVNVAPTLTPIGPKTINELVNLSFAAAATDPDVVGGNPQTLTFSLPASPPAGASMSGAGAFSWTPAEDQDGVHNVTVRVSDGVTDDDEVVSITVNEVNVAPTLTLIGTKTTDELVNLNFTIAATDPDLVGGVANTLTFSAPTLPAGASFTPGTQGFSWTPTELQDGSHSAVFQVSDGSLTDDETVSITVNEVNVAPTLDAIVAQTVNELTLLTFTATGSDPDVIANVPQPVTFSLPGSPPAGASITGAGAFSWTPAENQDGSHTVTVRISDGVLSDDQGVSITVNEVNVAPTLTLVGNKTTDELVNLSFTIAATDPDLVGGVANTLAFSAPTLPTGATFTPGTQSFSWTPTELQDGIHNASFKVSDGVLEDSEAITITVAEVNVAPTLDEITPKTVNELVLLGFTATGSDPDVIANVPQPVTYSLTGSPPAGATITGAGAFSWTPAEDQDGSHTVTVRISDGVLSDDQGVSITVNEVNIAPTLTLIGNKSTNELVNLSFTIAATDPDLVGGVPNTLTFSAPTLPALATFTPGTKTFSWTPSELQDGNHSASFQVSDGLLSDDETISIAVAEVNVAPTLDAIGPKTINELVLLSFSATGSDPDVIAGTPQPVTFSLTGSPPAGTAITGAGAFTWTPTELQDGVHSVTVQISDGTLTDDQAVSVTVNEINLAPDLAPIGNQAVNELVQLTFNASATDADFVLGVANTKTFSLDVGAPAGAAITAAGVFTWTPTEAQGPGTFPVTVRVTDNGVPVLNDFETFNIVVAEVNLPPVLTVPGTQTLNWGNVMSVSASASDPDVPANVLTFSLTSAPAGVTINGTSGAIGWTPTAAQIGPNTVTVRVTDNGTGALYDEESFTVNVNKRPTTLVYGGATSGQYSDPITASATLTDNGGEALQGSAIAGKPVTFTLGSQSVSPTPNTNAGGIASGSITLNQSPTPSYSMVSAFATDASYVGSGDSDAFDITQEDARGTYTGPMLVASNSLSDPTATIPLQATIRDISAVPGDPDTDASGGNVTNAKVTFIIGNELGIPLVSQPAGCSNLNVSLIGADPKIGTAGCNVTLTSGGDMVVYTVEIKVNNYYQDLTSALNILENEITVVQLAPGSISGGGYGINQQSNGTYKGATGLKTNYGFNTKFNKSGKGIQGKVNIVVRGENGKKYHIKSTSVDNMGLLPDGHAEFYSKANITDITNPLAPINLGGGYNLAITLWDKGEPGSSDILGITLKNGTTLLYSSHWDGVKTIEKLVDGGNLQVRQK